MSAKRVHQIITCPHYQNGEYDEAKHGGHAAEAVLTQLFSKYGFEPQKEVRYGMVVGHPDLMRVMDDVIEIIEIKNTAHMSYSHVLQVALYKSLVHKVYNKPVVSYLLYVKFRTVVGDSPVKPEWVRALDFDYIFLPIESGNHYVNWAQLRATYRSKIAGPYCVYCKNNDCQLKRVIIGGISNTLELPEE